STGKLSVVTPSGSGQSAGTFKVLPKLSSFSPGSGAAGASVTIAGSGFTDVSAVKFNGVAASSFSVDSSIQITATVPPTATTGRLTAAAAVGATVTLSGYAFGSATSVLFGGVLASPLTVTPTRITVAVPADAVTGKLAVVTPSGSGQSGGTFRVLPKLISFTPGSGPVGT